MLEKEIRERISDFHHQVVIIHQEDSIARKELQAADFISWAFFQKYERGDCQFYEIISGNVIIEKVIRDRLWKIPQNTHIDRIDFHWDNSFQQMLKRRKTVKITEFENKAKEAILLCFQDIPFLIIKEAELEPSFGDNRPDIQLTLEFKDEVKYVIVEAKNNGEPRYARQAVNQLLRYLESKPEAYGVYVAPYISPQAAAICQEAGIGTIDLAGNCKISFGKIYIRKDGSPNPFTRKRFLRSLYTPKAERILRVLLTTGLREWKTEELAGEADVSIGQVANVKKLLVDQEWMDSKTVGFSLTDPTALLEDWSQNYIFRRNKALNYYSMLSPAEVEYRVGEVCQRDNIRYGLTGFSGSSRYAPAVRYQRAMAYILGDIDVLTESLEIKPVESGFNVTLLEPYDESVLYGSQEIEGSRVVSSIQTFLDLKSLRGRGEEAAEALFERVIRKIW